MGSVNPGCARFSGLGGVVRRSYAGGCPFAAVGANQPAATDPSACHAFADGTSEPASRRNAYRPCLLGRNKISLKQPVAPGKQQPERLTMSTNILSPASTDTNGLTVDDTVSVARAFAIIGASCISFAIIAGATIASIA